MKKSQSGNQFDEIDLKILTRLQDDASQPLAALAAQVNLSVNACWRRVKRFEENGIIRKRVALLDAEAVGSGVTVFATVKAAEHSAEWLESFARVVRGIPEVTEFYRMSGDVDYLLKIQVESIAAYDEVYRHLIQSARLSDVSSAFAMEEIKNTTALPLPRPS